MKSGNAELTLSPRLHVKPLITSIRAIIIHVSIATLIHVFDFRIELAIALFPDYRMSESLRNLSQNERVKTV